MKQYGQYRMCSKRLGKLAIAQSMDRRVGAAFQNCAEPWMAEPKRHIDVLERVLKSRPHLPNRQAKTSKLFPGVNSNPG
jgi:hypothetical protein